MTCSPLFRRFPMVFPVLVLLAAMVLSPCVRASDNLIPKGDFDAKAPTAEGVSEPVWTDAGDIASARIVASGEGNTLVFERRDAKGGAWYWLIDKLPVLPGQRYYLSFDVRVGAAQARVNLQFREVGGGWVPQNDPASMPTDVTVEPEGVALSIIKGGLTTVTVTPKSVPNPEEFTKVGLTFTAPEAAASVRIALGMAMMTGIVEFDNVSLQEL